MRRSKILIVGDKENLKRVFSKSLKKEGYGILIAENAGKGLEVFTQEKPPIVLLDIKLPEMGGIEMLKRIKEVDPETEVIIFTGYGDVESAIQALKLDAADFLIKPVSEEALSIALNRAQERINTRRKLKRTNEKLHYYQKRLRSAQEKIIQTEKLSVLYKFASFIVHDLRNLVLTLSLAVRGLQNEAERVASVKPHIDAITTNIERMKELIAKLSSFPDGLEFKFKKCDVVFLIRNVLSKFKLPRIKISGRLPHLPQIDCDNSLQLVFYNLIKNSIEAMPFGGELSISAGLTKTGRHIKIRIADTGLGIPEDLVKNLFKPFQTTKEKGLGIGLYQCNEIIKRHRGKITLKSKLNQGTECSILLPTVQRISN